MRARAAIGFLIVLGAIQSISQAAWAPPAGFSRTSDAWAGDAFAVAPDGKVALAAASSGGGATIKVYASAAAAQSATSPIQTFTSPGYKFWGDLTFTDSNTLLFSENGDRDTVYRGIISSGATTPLAADGSVPSAGGVVQVGSTVYCVAVKGPGINALYALAGGIASAVLSNFGTGYAGGIAVDGSGNFLLSDSNDPTFAGNPGNLLRYTSSFTPLAPIGLAGGGGSGAYDVILDSEGDTYVTTGATLTRIPFGTTTAQQFGSTFGAFAFISNADYQGAGFEPNTGIGRLFVNAAFGDDGAIIGATPVPEPAACALILAGGIAIFARRRLRFAAPVAVLLALFAGIPSTARAEHFFASQVISTMPGSQQQTGFTDPTVALGPPRGGGIDQASTDVYNLGNGGYLTLGFDTATSQGRITNAPGPDFIVFENSFYRDGDPHAAFAELMWVSVSTDGHFWSRFSPTSKTPAPVPPFGVIDPDDVTGFAGVHPVYANPDENTIDPFNPDVAGGDAFDLEDLRKEGSVSAGVVDLNNIRYIRLADVIGNGSRFDPVGRAIFDPTGGGVGGADVDAVAVIHGVHLPEPATGLCIVTLVLLRLRREPTPSSRYAGERAGERG